MNAKEMYADIQRKRKVMVGFLDWYSNELPKLFAATRHPQISIAEEYILMRGWDVDTFVDRLTQRGFDVTPQSGLVCVTPYFIIRVPE